MPGGSSLIDVDARYLESNGAREKNCRAARAATYFEQV
jgi:hypothetical protein